MMIHTKSPYLIIGMTSGIVLVSIIFILACAESLDSFYGDLSNKTTAANQSTQTTGAVTSSTHESSTTVSSLNYTMTSSNSTTAVELQPEIDTAPSAVDIDKTEATILWTTNVTTSSQVELSTTSDFELGSGVRFPAVNDGNYVSNHEVVLQGLASDTQYYFMVISITPQGEEVTSELSSFQTTAFPQAGNYPPEFITDPVISNIYDTSAQWDWVMSKEGSSEIVYSTTPDFFDENSPPNFGGTRDGDAGDRVYFHTMNIASFTNDTTYYYHIISEDADGNVGYSEQMTFKTKPQDDRLGWVGYGGTCSPAPCFNIDDVAGSNYCGSNGFSRIYGMDVDDSGNIYVVDNSYNRVQKYQSDGNYMGYIGNYDSTSDCDDYNGHYRSSWTTSSYATTAANTCLGCFNRPVKVTVDNTNGYIYVGDRDNHRIARYSLPGQLEETLGSYLGNNVAGWHNNAAISAGTGDNQFNQPYGIGVDSNGFLYIADGTNHRIKKYQTDGTYIGCIGGGDDDFSTGCTSSAGSGDAYFYTPTDIVVGSDGTLYITDTSNHRVQRFGSDGSFMGWIGQGSTTGWNTSGHHAPGSGKQEGAFSSPYGVELDPDENLYIAEYGNHRVSKWNKEGVYQGWLGKDHTTFALGLDTIVTSGGNWGDLNGPIAVAYDESTDRLYVGEYHGQRVQAWQF